MDLFSTLQLVHEAVMSVLVTTMYGRWRGTITEITNLTNIRRIGRKMRRRFSVQSQGRRSQFVACTRSFIRIQH